MSQIETIHGREIIDSRGNPTVEADVFLEHPALPAAPRYRAARPPASVKPSSCATASRTAISARASRTPSANVHELIGPALEGMDATDQIEIDRTMLDLDGTPNKAKLGANAMLAVSLATARAAASELGLPLWRYLGGPMARTMPVPMMNILNGGAHADEHRRLPGVHDPARGRGDVPRRAAHGRGGLPRAQEGAREAEAVDRCGRRGRLRARPRQRRGRARADRRGHRRGRLHAGPGYRARRSTWRRASCTWTALPVPEERGAAKSPRSWRTSTPAGWRSTPSCRSRTAWPRTTGPAGSC
jgi:hypothetical protein